MEQEYFKIASGFLLSFVVVLNFSGLLLKFEVCSVDEFLNVQEVPSVGAMVLFDR